MKTMEKMKEIKPVVIEKLAQEISPQLQPISVKAKTFLNGDLTRYFVDSLIPHLLNVLD